MPKSTSTSTNLKSKTPAKKIDLITPTQEDVQRYDLSAHKHSAGAASHLSLSIGYDSLTDAFPEVDPQFIPFGSRVLVQIRRTKSKTKGGVIITDETKETEKWNVQVGKVVGLGSLAFKSRKDLTPWPEGSWANIGEFVRFPKYGGDKWEVEAPDGLEPVLFVLFEDKDLLGRYTGDPLKVKAFV